MKTITLSGGPHKGKTKQVNDNVREMQIHVSSTSKERHEYHLYVQQEDTNIFVYKGKKAFTSKPIDYSMDDS